MINSVCDIYMGYQVTKTISIKVKKLCKIRLKLYLGLNVLRVENPVLIKRYKKRTIGTTV